MASSARMDELRKKFDENPRRYFAPLANEYRKVGDLEQAIFICQEYLPQQPGHMSGHIVYGQALFESGREEEARAVFETALALDPENLIALRHLGDIARNGGDPEGARLWYHRVLEADPRNEEIAALLDALPPGADAPSGAEPPGTAATVPSFSDAPTVEVPAMRAEPAESVAPAEPVVEADSLAIERGGGEDQHIELEPSPAEEQTESPEFEQALDLELTIPGVPAPGAAATVDLIIEEVTPAEPPADADVEGLLDLEDFALPGSPAAPQAADLELSDPFGGVLGAPAPLTEDDNVAPANLAPDLDLPAASDEPESAPEEVGMVVEFVDSAPPAEATPMQEAFVTETMAELYLRQGHVAEALDLYDRLMAQRPGDEALAARAAAARRETLGGPTIREYLRSIFRGAAGTATPPETNDAGAAGGAPLPGDADEAMAAAYARGFGREQS